MARLKTKRPDVSTPRWQVVENVVAAIERILGNTPGFTVTQKVQMPRLSNPSDTRDIDVLVEVPSGHRTLRVAIEVKHKHRPLSIDQLGSIADLKNDVAADRFCVVSTSGFSRAARVKAAENNIDLSTLEEFTHSDFWAYPPVRHLRNTGGEIITALFIFVAPSEGADDKGLHDVIAEAGLDEITLTDSTGTVTARIFISAMLYEYVKSRDPAHSDGDRIDVRLDLRARNGLRLRVRGRDVPGPSYIDVAARLRITLLEVPERRFRFGDIELATAEMTLFGTPQQVSIAKVPRPDGSTQLIFSRGPAQPPPARSDK